MRRWRRTLSVRGHLVCGAGAGAALGCCLIKVLLMVQAHFVVLFGVLYAALVTLWAQFSEIGGGG